MLRLKFGEPPGPSHKCETLRQEDWIIFRCPECIEYEHWYNWRTGETKSHGINSGVQHWGNYLNPKN